MHYTESKGYPRQLISSHCQLQAVTELHKHRFVHLFALLWYYSRALPSDKQDGVICHQYSAYILETIWVKDKHNCFAVNDGRKLIIWLCQPEIISPPEYYRSQPWWRLERMERIYKCWKNKQDYWISSSLQQRDIAKALIRRDSPASLFVCPALSEIASYSLWSPLFASERTSS